jgi:hypothetical protein
MTDDKQTSVPDKAIAAAKKWRTEHPAHVARLVASETQGYPPSGFDAFQPTLWKAPHWHWLKQAHD